MSILTSSVFILVVMIGSGQSKTAITLGEFDSLENCKRESISAVEQIKGTMFGDDRIWSERATSKCIEIKKDIEK